MTLSDGSRQSLRKAVSLDAKARGAHHSAMTSEPKEPKESRHKDAHERRRSLEDTILQLCADAGAAKTIDPIVAARTFSQSRGEDEADWRNWLVHVRSAAVGLARQGKLVIYRKGKPANPDDFRGVYRLGLPRGD
jgi:hypothetical protein